MRDIHSKNQENLKERKKILISIFSLIIIAIAIFLLISFIGYTADACITNYGFFKTGGTLIGSYGDCVADYLFNLLGKSSYLLPFVLLYIGYLIVKNSNQESSSLSSIFTVISGLFVIMFAVAPSFFDLWLENENYQSNMGTVVLNSLVPAVGSIFTNLMLFFILVICLTLILKISWLEMVEKTGSVIWQISQFFYDNFLSKFNNLKTNSVIPKTVPKKHPSPGLMNELKNKKKEQPIHFNTPLVNEKSKTPSIKPKPMNTVAEENLAQINYSLPNVNLLEEFPSDTHQYSRKQLQGLAELIEKKLMDFKIGVKVVEMHPGPVITRFELDLDNGVKVSQVSNLSKDLARSLSLSSVRIVDVIPGKPYIGIEIPNQSREMVSLKEIIDAGVFKNAKSPLTIALGKDISGKTRIVDLATMPHLLVAGTTGSGKSVAINAMILSILYKSTPEEVKLILIDPKMIELSVYQDVPHLIAPVVTQMEKAFSALQWCVYEMNRRYKLMTEYKFTHLSEFNRAISNKEKKGESFLDEDGDTIEKMPYIVVFIDEFADLISVEGKKIENLVARLAGKARAAGIHLVIATQRPSVNVITGVIKANIPSRIAFQLPTKIDSRTILDDGGAEQLLGKGDMLYLASGASLCERIHGAFVSRDEVNRVIEYWKNQAEVQYREDVINYSDAKSDDYKVNTGTTNPISIKDSDDEKIYREAVELVIKDRKASISYVQRKLQIGYNRSANLIERMEAEGIVSSPAQNSNRTILVNTIPNFEKENDETKENENKKDEDEN